MGKNINFSKSQKEDICNRYISGESTYSISKFYNCSNVTVSNILKSERIEIRSNKKFNRIIELEICDKYKNGIHSYELSEIYNCSATAIIGVLHRNNIKMRTSGESHKKYSLNEDYFNSINTEDKAYWLGWLYADGCNQKNYNVSIGLHKNDAHIIEMFKKYIGSNKPLYKKTDESCVELQFRSKKLSNSLKKAGCIYNKSLILEFPNKNQVPYNLLPHFVRGYLEGDGCVGVYKTKNMISILGTKKFLTEMKKYLESKNISGVYINPKTKNT